MSLRNARKWFNDNFDDIRDAFYEKFQAPCGGLYNPQVVCVDSLGHLEIRCHYDNYDNDEDSWTWFLVPGTLKFYR